MPSMKRSLSYSFIKDLPKGSTKKGSIYKSRLLCGFLQGFCGGLGLLCGTVRL